jgi:hypothetical protein
VVPTGLVLVPLLLIYLYFMTGGDWTFAKIGDSFYNDMGEAFAAGQLSLKREPVPELLALENPYDPRLNADFRYHDASLYRGKYYLYWGPFPGVIHAAWLIATGSTINHGMMQFVAMALVCVIVWTLLYQIRQDYFPRISNALLIALMLQFALSPTMLFLVSRPTHYHEAPIVGTWMLAGSWLCFFHFLRVSARNETSRFYLILSGVLLGFAVASRITLAMYGVATAAVLCLDLFKLSFPTRRALTSAFVNLVAFGAPVAIVGVVLLLYNYLRFGSVFEFGMAYALHGSSAVYDAIRRPDGTNGSFFAWSRVGVELLVYLLLTPTVTMRAPYLIDGVVITRDITNRIDLGTLNFEPPIIGLFLIAPVTLFLCALPFKAFRSVDDPTWPARALAIASGVGAVCTLLLVSAVPGMTMRYMADFVPGFALAGSIACMLVVSRLDASRLRPNAAGLGRALARWLSPLVVVATVPVVLAGFAFGLMAWRLIYPYAVRDAYEGTDELLARAYAATPCQNPGWRSTSGQYLDAERLVFSLEPECLALPGRPAPSVLRSVTVSSALAQSTPAVVEANGRRVAGERIYPGLQTLLLDEAVEVDSHGQLQLQLDLPEQPAPPAPARLAVGVIRASDRAQFGLADSYGQVLQRWIDEAERRRDEAEQARLALEQARSELTQLRARIEADDEQNVPALQAQVQVIRGLAQRLQELSHETDAARVEAGDARSRVEQIKARIKADGPTSQAKKKLQAEERTIAQLDQRVSDLEVEAERVRVATDEARAEMGRLRAQLDAERRRSPSESESGRLLQAQEQVVSERERIVRVKLDELRPAQDREDTELRRIAAKQAVVDAAAQP